jgi:NAD(P)-dependent dehydrogenase (short-subunit alcohol dehydrogenase family)
MTLEGGVAIVTGGASGIGAATCHELAGRGANVIVADLDAEAGRETATEIAEESDADARFVEVDVSEEAAVEAAVETAIEEFGGLDVVVNNAAVASREADGPVTEFDQEAFEFIAGINLSGPAYLCKHAIPAMHENGDGTGAIVNNASVAALVAEPGMDGYTATKGALVSLTRSIAVEYAPDIRANTVCPGVVETPMLEDALDDSTDTTDETLRTMVEDTPLGMAAPADVAGAIGFLASEKAAFLTGTTVPVDGGYTAR